VDSILDSVKKILGIDKEYTAFDVDIVIHINTVLANLNQLGVGPVEGFAIEDASPTWDDFLGEGNPTKNNIKTYVALKVKMVFDPPTTGYLIDATNKNIQELEWRISVKRENDEWVPPVPATVPEPEVIIIPSSQAWYSE